ncbi:MAG: PAS domain-containing protein [Gammaproteobacteria bacterium]
MSDHETIQARRVLPEEIDRVFGDGGDDIRQVERRARDAYPGQRLIVWEGDPQTFAFGYVGGDAEQLLGHPASAWLGPSFWVESIVHPEDRRDAVAYCALASGKACDHVFEYRAVHPAGGVVWLLDYVRVVLGPRGIPSLLRGLMFDITAEKTRSGAYASVPSYRLPSIDQLQALP